MPNFKSNPQGIDYAGLFSAVNRDKETGIRYGVISCNALHERFYEAQEMDYGKPTCPVCCNETVPVTDAHADWEQYTAHGCSDHACETCKHTLDSSECFPDEAQGWHIDDGEYKVIDCLDSDAMVIKSPFYTYAQFCSPCVPGACSMDSPIAAEDITPDSVKSYCFGHDWFDGNIAPYPVYSVDTGAQILPSDLSLDGEIITPELIQEACEQSAKFAVMMKAREVRHD